MTHEDGTTDTVKTEDVIIDGAGNRFTREEMNARVTVLEDGIIVMREMTKPSPATLEAMGARIEALAAGRNAYGILVDLSDNQGSTSTDYRRFIPQYFSELTARSHGAVKLVAVVFRGNPVLRVAANFIVARITDTPFALFKTHDEAVDAIRKALR